MRTSWRPFCALALLTTLLACNDDSAPPVVPTDALSVGGSTDAGASDARRLPDTAVSVDAATKDAKDASVRDSGGDTAPLLPGALKPRGYLQASDSPFGSVDFMYFHREDFEDGKLNTPGVTAPGRPSSSFSPGIIDSVDGDDGIPNDNRCIKSVGTCDAWWGNGTLTFTFDAEALGGLPTHAGAVWTDGSGEVGFEAFGPDGQVVYSVAPFSEPGFPGPAVTSDTSEDRFFGVHSPAGISAIRVYNTAGGIEVDHLQYGRAR